MNDLRQPRDVDELIRSLGCPPAPERATAWPEEDVVRADVADEPIVPWYARRWVWAAGGLVVAAAAALTLALVIGPPHETGPKGIGVQLVDGTTDDPGEDPSSEDDGALVTVEEPSPNVILVEPAIQDTIPTPQDSPLLEEHDGIADVVVDAETEDDGIRFRGNQDAGPPTVDFYLAVKEGRAEERGTARRFLPGERLTAGRIVYFTVASSEAATVRIWVDGPGGRESIWTVEAGSNLRDVRSGDHSVAYQFDGIGEYAFAASAQEGDVCQPPSCVVVRVQVGE